jgi:hypothetical protein
MEAGTKRTAAVIVRGHMESEKLTDLAARLHDPESYDLYVATSHLRGPMIVGPYPQLLCDVEALHAIGFQVETEKFFYDFGDAVIYLALQRLPAYDHYVVLEHDVDFSGDASGFINDLLAAMRAQELDMVGPRLGEQGPWWTHWAYASAKYDEVWAVFLPILAVSARAARLLHQRRLEEGPPTASFGERVFCEAFVASELHAAGYAIRDLNAVVPGAYSAESFYYGAPVLAKTIACLRSDIRALHPVYPPPEFLRAHLDQAYATGTLLQFATYLGEPHPLISDDLRREWGGYAEQALAWYRSQQVPAARLPLEQAPPVIVLPSRPRWAGAGLDALEQPGTQDVGGRPVIDHVMEHLRAGGAKEVVVVGSDMSPLRPGAAPFSGPLDVAALLAFARDHGWSRFMVCYGDCLSDADLGELVVAHDAAGKPATVLGVRPSPLLAALTGDLVPVRDDRPHLGDAGVNGGFVLLEVAALDDAPPGETVEMLLQRLNDQGRLTVVKHAGFWEAVQTGVVLETVRRLWAADRAPWKSSVAGL